MVGAARETSDPHTRSARLRSLQSEMVTSVEGPEPHKQPLRTSHPAIESRTITNTIRTSVLDQRICYKKIT